MGFLDKYNQVGIPIIIKKEKQNIEEPEELEPIILPDDSKCITLADFSPVCKDVLRVHNLANYRRRPEIVILLPDLHVTTDFLIFDREELAQCIPIL